MRKNPIHKELRGKHFPKASFALSSFLITVLASTSVVAQDEEVIEEVVVTGIRSALKNAVEQKQNSDNLIEVIQAVDIGKLPDQNLAEVLENVTGVQITRQWCCHRWSR